MINEEAEALGRRWIAAGGGWRAGMAAIHENGSAHRLAMSTQMSEAWWPDLRDPATRGAALEVVRERWRSAFAHARQRGSFVVKTTTYQQAVEVAPAWEVCDLYLDAEGAKAIGASKPGLVGFWGFPSEIAALVAALEAAPGKP